MASRAQIDRLADMRLKDTWIGRETLTLQLSPRQIALEPGDTISYSVDGLPRLFRVTEVADAKARRLTAVSTERAPAASVAIAVRLRPPAAPALAGVPFAVALELPGVRGSQPVLQHIAVPAAPWPGVLDVLRSAGGASFEAVTSVRQPAPVGRLLGDLEHGPLWRWDQRNAVEITVESGDLQSVSDLAALDGANTFAIEGPDGQWELLSAARIDLTGPCTYRLSRLLLGLAGSEPAAAQRVSAGALVIGVDEALVPLTTALSDLGRELTYRVVPSGLDAADPSVLEIVTTAQGLALKPLAPVRLRARRGAGGITFGWTRRSRNDGDNWEPADPPLGEAFGRQRLSFLQRLSTWASFGRGWSARVAQTRKAALALAGPGRLPSGRNKETKPVTEPKSLFTSRTVWANLVGLAAVLLSIFGFDTSTMDSPGMADVIAQSVAGISFVASTIFRVIATRRLAMM